MLFGTKKSSECKMLALLFKVQLNELEYNAQLRKSIWYACASETTQTVFGDYTSKTCLESFKEHTRRSLSKFSPDLLWRHPQLLGWYYLRQHPWSYLLTSAITSFTAVSSLSANEGNCKCLNIMADERSKATGFAFFCSTIFSFPTFPAEAPCSNTAWSAPTLPEAQIANLFSHIINILSRSDLFQALKQLKWWMIIFISKSTRYSFIAEGWIMQEKHWNISTLI